MPPRNNVDRLPDGMRDKAIDMLRKSRPIREITDFLNQLAEEAGIEGVSKSGVGRWVAGQEEAMDALRRANTLAEAWKVDLKNNPEGKLSRLLIELAQTNILEVLLAQAQSSEDGEKIKMDPLSLQQLATSIAKLETASTISVEREKTIRKQVREQAAEAAATVGKAKGLTADAVAEMRRTILGITA